MINRPLFYTACAVLGLMVGVGAAEAVTPPPAEPKTVLVTSSSEADTSGTESGEPRRKAASDTPDVPTARGLVSSRSTAPEPVTQPTGTPAAARSQEEPVSEPTPEPQDEPQVKQPASPPQPVDRQPAPDRPVVGGGQRPEMPKTNEGHNGGQGNGNGQGGGQGQGNENGGQQDAEPAESTDPGAPLTQDELAQRGQ